jgi:hypothetical protein
VQSAGIQDVMDIICLNIQEQSARREKDKERLKRFDLSYLSYITF